MKGIINLFKPPGMTSSDAVVWLRRQLGQRRIGHTGTLDPEAAGVLPVLVGKAARLSDTLMQHDKQYVAEAVFGSATDTQDAWGKTVALSDKRPDETQVRAALQGFVGEQLQMPSAYSAVRVDGKKAYELAREGKTPNLKVRRVQINALELIEMRRDRCRIRISCSKGTYVRALIHDLGEHLGCQAHMGALLRTRVGAFELRDAVTVEQVIQQGAGVLLPMDSALGDLPRVTVKPSAYPRASNGNPLGAEHIQSGSPCEGVVKIYFGDELIALGRWHHDASVRIQALLMGD